jgi:DNA polymerase-1
MWLHPVLAMHPRKLIVTLGNEARAGLHLDKAMMTGITKVMGSVVPSPYNCPVVWTCHPALCLRSPEYTPVLFAGLKKGHDLLTGEMQPEAPCTIPTINVEGLAHALSLINGLPTEFAFDIETTGLDFAKHHIVGIAFAHDREAFYLPIIEQGRAVWSVMEWRDIYRALEAKFAVAAAVGHNVKFDLKFLVWAYGLRPRQISGDTMLRAQLVDENLPLNLQFLATSILNAPAWKSEVDHSGRDLPVWQKAHPNMWQPLRDYAAKDVAYTWLLDRPMRDAVDSCGCTDLYDRVTAPLLEVLHRAERRGMRVDVDATKRLSARLRDGAARQLELILSHVPKAMRPEMTLGYQKLSWLLFKQLRLTPSGILTDSGGPSTSKEAVEQMAPHPVTDALIAYRHLTNLDSNFAAGVLAHVKSDGRVHTTFQWNPRSDKMVRTGRIQASGPNVLAHPKGLRPVYVGGDGSVIISADASQMELRCLAVCSGDPQMKQAFIDGKDIHKATASEMLGIPYDQLTKEDRSQGKTLNFALVYGLGDAALAADLGCSVAEAAEKKAVFFSRMPLVKRWLDEQVEIAQQRGWVVSPLGRRRRIPTIWSDDEKDRSYAERQAKNAPIQGMGADICHIKASELLAPIEPLAAGIVNAVHDQLVIEVPRSQQERVLALLEEILPQPPFAEWDIPLVWDIEAHRGWDGDEIDFSKLDTYLGAET